jgi:sulfoxide reductase heme-binding subunit YedZ
VVHGARGRRRRLPAADLGVALGLLLAERKQIRDWPRFALEDVHRFAGLLAGFFVALHVGMILVDSRAHFSLARVVVPFAASYRPFWTGLGVVTAELLVALALANRYRAKIGYRTWRRLHYLFFAVWLGATAHGLGSGTDRGTAWLLGIYLVSITTVTVLTVRRALRGKVTLAPQADS